MSQKALLLVIARRIGLVLLLSFAFESFDFLSAGYPERTIAGAPQGSSRLREIVESGKLQDLRWPDFSDYKAVVSEFYDSYAYAPAWLQGTEPSPQALALIEVFKSAWKRGLQPEDYDASRWDARLGQLQTSNGDSAPFDVAITVCTMRFVSDLHIGRINPKHFRFGLSIEQKKYDLAQYVRDRLVPASDVSSVLDEVEPPFAGYRRTEAALLRYSQIVNQDDGEQLPPSDKPIEPGQHYTGVPRLIRILKLVGDLPSDATLASDPQLYDGALVEAVKAFQRRHGLKDDGRIGAETLKQLNVPLSDRVRQLQLALERWRWLPSEFSAPPIIVNIPDFQLRALDETNNVALKMRVVVGKAMRTQTPVFSRDMTYVVLRPYWNVPPSILRGEIVPAIQRNPHYVANKRYEVTTNDGEVVTDGTVSDEVLSQLRAGKLAIRQKPGPSNALGLVKLMFPNEYNVYLHSTPAAEFFSRTRRDFSHGCIRVEKPAELTAWALRNNPGWTLERVKESMEGSDNVTVKLNRPIPVFIVYATALAYESGEVHFYNDIYAHDASLAQALAKGYPYP
ncbi:MAG TPA: L,D-transpeptidase family protein [Dongiaceae bacterium]|nr:L,D-transpeptidase family protein [Dongiaceae bacterium]